jgi:ABC-type amino acid transport substrate-binding protein
MRTRMALLLVAALLAAACGSEEVSTTTTLSTSTLPSTTTTVATTATTAPTTTSTAAETTTMGQAIDVFIEGGQVVGPGGRFSFSVGDQVSIWVLSDTPAEIHVHGYDVSFAAEAGVPIEVSLFADVPGIFEVELEETHTPLFELEVTP